MKIEVTGCSSCSLCNYDSHTNEYTCRALTGDAAYLAQNLMTLKPMTPDRCPLESGDITLTFKH